MMVVWRENIHLLLDVRIGTGNSTKTHSKYNQDNGVRDWPSFHYLTYNG